MKQTGTDRRLHTYARKEKSQDIIFVEAPRSQRSILQQLSKHKEKYPSATLNFLARKKQQIPKKLNSPTIV